MNKYTESSLTSYCLGMSLTIEALKNRSNYMEKIYLSSKANKNTQLDSLLKLCEDFKIEVEYNDLIIDKLSIKENCYCIGVFKKFNSSIKTNKHIVLYGFNDFGELGTVLRSAVSFDFKDIVLVNSNIDYFDPRCIRASMGSIFHCNIEKYKTIDEYKAKYNLQTLIPFLAKANNELKTLNVSDNYSLIISQKYDELDLQFKDGYYLKHLNLDEISLSIRSSIIFNYTFSNLKR